MNVATARKIKQEEQQSALSPVKIADDVPAASRTLITENVYTSQAEALNMQMHSDLEDSRCVIGVLHTDLAADMMRWRARWQSWADNNAGLVATFDKGYRHTAPSAVSARSVDSSAVVKLDTEWFLKYGPLDDVDVAAACNEHFKRLREVIGPQKKDDAKRALKALAERLYPLDQHRLAETVMDLHEFHHADPLALLKADLAKSFNVVAGLEAQVAQTSEERDACLRTEDIGGAEQRSQQLLGQLAKIIGVVGDRHAKAVETEADVQEFRQNFAALRESMENEKLGQELRELRATADADAASVRQATEALEAEQRAHEQAYTQRTTSFREKLKENTHAQNDAWERITAAVEQLKTLTGERDVLIDEHCRDTVAERQRAKKSDDLIFAMQRRLEELERLAKHVGSGLEFLRVADDYAKTVVEAIEQRDAPGKLRKIEIDERLRYYDIYKRYALFAAGAELRKEQRLENVRRLVRATEFQVANATHAMDTDLPLYKQQLETLRTTENNLLVQVGELRAEIEAQALKWQPVQALLEECDVEVEPPQLLVQELRRDLMRNHVEAMDVLTNNEQKLLDSEKAQVRKIQNACEATKAVLDERRQTRKNAKATQ